MERILVIRYYMGVFLLNSISLATHDTGRNLHCTNDYDRLMFCRFGPPSEETNCAEYSINTRVYFSSRHTESNCNLTPDKVRTGTCSCSLNINGFVLWESHNTTLWKAGDLVEYKSIAVYDNIKPKAPKLTSVTKENENYLVTWDTQYDDPAFDLKVLLTYHKEGEKGTEVNVSAMKSYQILGEFLEPDTEYLVNVRSYSSFYSESSDNVRFTTPVSSISIGVVIILSLCVVAVITTSSLFLFCTRFKESWWDSFGNYKNSTILVMVPGEHKVLIPEKVPLHSVYVDHRKDDEDGEKTWDRSSGGNSLQSAGADSAISSLGYSQKVSLDVISNVEEALRMAFPQLSTAPWLFIAHSNTGYYPVAGTSSLSTFENMTYFMAPPSGTQGLSAANPLADLSESFYNPSMLWGVLHNRSPDSKVPIFQMTGQRQPLVSRLDSSHMKTDFSYQSWNADSGSSSQTDALQVDLSYSSFSSDITSSSSILSGFGSSVSGENLKEALLVRAADQSSMMKHVSGEEKQSFKVCDSNPCEESCPSPACGLVSVDDDFQVFKSMVGRPGVLIPKASGSRPRDQPDNVSETLFTGMPQRAIDGASTLPPTTQGVQGLLETQANKVSLLPADQHKLIIISDYHSV